MQNRILFISDNKIQGFGGGSVENRKYYMALRMYCKQRGDVLRVISTDTEFQDALPVHITKNKKRDILVRLQGHSSFLYQVWRENLSMILEYNPNLVVLGRSRFGFIAKAIKKELPDCKVLSNIDNVEFDYVDAYFDEQKGIKGFLMKALEKVVVYRDEMDCVDYSDQLVYLTERNVRRYAEVYHRMEKNPTIIPICLEREIDLNIHSNTKSVIFIGSLDYAANVKAVIQLISDIWIPTFAGYEDVQLIIAGRNPEQKIRELSQLSANIKLVSNFENLQSIVPVGSLMVAPIQKGAGMKVKVAETLSMGLMIAASDEALVGYEEALERDKLDCIIRANAAEEYKNAILLYISKTENELKHIERQNKEIYRELYSYQVSHKAIENLCDRMLSE